MDIFNYISHPLFWLVITLPIITFLVSYDYLTTVPWRNLPPGPSALPLVGSLPFMEKDRRKAFRRFGVKYGDLFTVYIGKRRMVVLNSYSVIKEAHLRHGQIILGLADGFFSTVVRKNQGIICSSGHLWEEQRGYGIHVLKELGLGRPVIESRVLEEVEELIKDISKQGTNPFNPMTFIHNFTFSVIISVLTGRRMHSTNPRYIRLVDSMRVSAKMVTAINADEYLPYTLIRCLSGDPCSVNKLINAYEGIREEFQSLIDEHRADYIDDGDPEDFIGAYLRKIKGEGDNPHSTYNEEQLCHVITDFFLPGSDTPATTLCWGILFMCIHQDVQTRLHTEIDDVIGRGGVPNMRHRYKLPFTEACIDEIQRMGDVLPNPPPRVVSEDWNFRGYFIPKGTSIVSNLNAVNYDPKLWKEPQTFNPERFLDEEGNKLNETELIPFHIGRRSCPGENLGRMELFLAFTSLMANFRFCFAPGQEEPENWGDLGLKHVPKPFQVVVEHRAGDASA